MQQIVAACLHRLEVQLANMKAVSLSLQPRYECARLLRHMQHQFVRHSAQKLERFPEDTRVASNGRMQQAIQSCTSPHREDCDRHEERLAIARLHAPRRNQGTPLIRPATVGVRERAVTCTRQATIPLLPTFRLVY